MVVFDSDILIGIMREDKDAINFMDDVEKRNEKLNTTVINVFEVLEGALMLANEEKIKKIENLLQAFDTYNFDDPVSRIAANISANLKKKGKTIDFQDIAIAAITMANSEVLATRNIKHFGRIKDLKIEKW